MDWAAGLGYVDTSTPLHVFAIRLLFAALFGGMIGFEREQRIRNVNHSVHSPDIRLKHEWEASLLYSSLLQNVSQSNNGYCILVVMEIL